MSPVLAPSSHSDSGTLPAAARVDAPRGNERPADWVDRLKAFAILGVMAEHWFSVIPRTLNESLAERAAALAAHGGTLVHLFLLASGYGLAASCLRARSTDWIAWARRRIARVGAPYWIVIVATFAATRLLHGWAPWMAPESYGWATLASYLTLTRNQYPPGWGLNSSFWFLPVIGGLYLVFPLMVRLLRRGALRFGLTIGLLNAAAIALWFVSDAPFSHQSSWFGLHLLSFGAGMLLADAELRAPRIWESLRHIGWLFAGLACYAGSAALASSGELGQASNDILTVVGAFLILYGAGRRIAEWWPALDSALRKLGALSYTLYLIHLPLFMWLTRAAGSRLGTVEAPRWSSVQIALCGAGVFGLTIALAAALQRPLDRASRWTMARLERASQR